MGTITELCPQHQNILICLSYIEQREKNVFWSKEKRERILSSKHVVCNCFALCVCVCIHVCVHAHLRTHNLQKSFLHCVGSRDWFRSLGLSTSPLPSEPSRWPCKVLLLFVFYVCIYYYWVCACVCWYACMCVRACVCVCVKQLLCKEPFATHRSLMVVRPGEEGWEAKRESGTLSSAKKLSEACLRRGWLSPAQLPVK